MRLIKSICTNLAFPESRKDVGAFRDMAGYLKGKGVACIEFFHDGNGQGTDKIGKVLADTGLSAVFIAVIPSKERKKDLCDTDEALRKDALAMTHSLQDEAWDNGIDEFMICSGRIGDNVDAQLDALADSVKRLYEYADRKNRKMRILLEPCDSWMDVKHLLGPYKRSIEFVERMRADGFPLELTMDSAHVVEEGENFADAMEAARPYCNHIHFANCHIRDPKNEFYGDKHLGFEYPDTPWSPAALADFFPKLEQLYPGDEPLRVALEVLCREPDPYAYFEKMWASLPFLSGHA